MRRLLASLAVAVLALAAAGCGNKEAKTLHGDTEGSYLDLGGLKYQVQISRLLNPNSIEDRAYLVGLNGGQSKLPAGQQWFGVFMRVENDGEQKNVRAATDFQIVDTQNNKYRPIQLAPVNVFAYRGGTLNPADVVPPPDSPAGQASIQGSLLLFRIPVSNFENRPLQLNIRSSAAPGQTATVNLDV
jgi:hypothetical protein